MRDCGFAVSDLGDDLDGVLEEEVETETLSLDVLSLDLLIRNIPNAIKTHGPKILLPAEAAPIQDIHPNIVNIQPRVLMVNMI